MLKLDLSGLAEKGLAAKTAAGFWALAMALAVGPVAAGSPFHPLFKPSASGAPDTLEVFVLYVQFENETTAGDNPTTTGLGTFGSDPDTSYTLDPNGVAIRTSYYYLDKHFQFANNYFNTVSGGRVVIKPRYFPRPDGEGVVIHSTTQNELLYHMAAYNPAAGDNPKLQAGDFQAERAEALMSFVSQSARLFTQLDSADNPFAVAAAEARDNPSPLRHPVFLIFHAGASRLVDGGTLGPLGANTPNDFLDFFVTKDDFKALDSATIDFQPGSKAAPEQRQDSLGVVVAAGDTISQFMMCSESASQDNVNWGIDGILINQLARQMGMPDLYDVVQGISQVGAFDVMDFAGYNTLNGFLPVFPSAWTRSFMGWDNPVVATPNGPTSYSIQAADRAGPGRIRTLEIPLNQSEYLLVENRQRADADSQVTIYYSKPASSTDYTFSVPDSVTVPYGFVDSLFVDTVCKSWQGSQCTQKIPNPKKPGGIITGASRYDLGLPGNGLLLWHVNQWFLDDFLKDDAVNAYLGDTLQQQYRGLALVEANGVPSIGKQFTDALGQPAFDYGSADDLFPVLFRARKNPPKDTSWMAPETLSVIGSYGFANTNTWNDGRTHIVLQGILPSGAKIDPSVGNFTGDSVFSYRDSALTLRVEWPDDSTLSQPPGSAWPVRTAPAGMLQAVNVLHDGSGGGPYLISVSDAGDLQTYTAAGVPALAARDTVSDSAHFSGVTSPLSSGNVHPQDAAPINSMVNPVGAPIGVCVARDSVLAVLTGQALRFVHPLADSLKAGARTGGTETTVPLRGAAGPLALGSKVFAVDSAGVLRGFSLTGVETDSVTLPLQACQALAWLPYGPNGDTQIVAAGAGGAAVRVDLAAHQAVDLHPAWGNLQPSADETFSVVTSDFNRDGQDDVFLLGSQGSALLFEARSDEPGQAFAGFPQRFTRSLTLTDTAGKSYRTEDRSPPALADLNGDGHPDILFSGSNAVYAVDWHGAVLPGWPFLPQPHQDVGFTYASALAPATVISCTPLVLSLRGHPAVLVGTPDGLVYAVDSTGKPVTYSSFSSGNNTGLLMTNRSDWPLTAGGLSLDTTQTPFVHLTLATVDSGLDLLAQTAEGSLSLWDLRNAEAKPGQNWFLPGGDAGRSNHFSAETLGAPVTPGAEETIEEFHLFPSPLRAGDNYMATIHLKVGAAADKARVRLFDLAGNPVKDLTFTGLTPGLQPFTHTLDLRRLGPDVYAALCEVWFPGGKKSAWTRIGIVK